jgi:hypothetical protein
MSKISTVILISLAMLVPPLHTLALSGGEILKDSVGARPSGMGEMYTALSGDLNTIYYNIAGMADLPAPEIESTYTIGLFENKNANLTFGLPVEWFGRGTIAAGMLNQAGAKMEINHLDGSTQNLISQNDFIWTVGYAHQITPRLYAGLSMKIYHSIMVEEYTALAYGGDLGILYKDLGLPGLNLGAALRTIGTEIKYLEHGDAMPATLRIGIAYARDFADSHNLKTGGDILFPNDRNPLGNFGIEYAWENMLFARAGYKLGYDIDTFTLGGGIKLYGLRLDYAFSSIEIGGNAHRFGLGYSF